MIPHKIVTPRAVIRCWAPSDAALLTDATVASLAELRPWMPWAHLEPVSLEDQMTKLLKFRAIFDMGDDHIYGVFSPDEREVLGGTGLHARVGHGGIEIGYWIRTDRTGQGLAREVAAALTRVAFEQHGVDRVEIRCEPSNVKSASVPRRLGFTHEGTLRRRFPYRDSFRDQMIWTLFADDYLASEPARLPIEAYDGIGRRLTLARAQPPAPSL